MGPRSRTATIALACAVVASMSIACGKFLGLSGSEEDAVPNGSERDGIDASSDVRTVTSENVAECTDRRPTPADALFVTADASSNACTRESPCTLPNALDLVRSRSRVGARILLAQGTYPFDLDLPADADLEGGFVIEGGAWKAVCDQRLVVLTSDQTATAVRAETAGIVRLSLLTVVTKPTPLSGESAFGVFAAGAGVDLRLDNVVVAAGPGGDGPPGADAVGIDRALTPCGQHDDGADGATGAAGAAGSWSFGSRGAQGNDGAAGAAGEFGHNGTLGGDGEVIFDTSCALNPDSDSCVPTLEGTSCSANGEVGRHGCGGRRGQGGGGGKAGGASVGVFAWDGARVTVARGAVASANGGTGGAGGNGSSGEQGTKGAVGQQAFALCTPPAGCGDPVAGACLNEVRTAQGGNPGGTGGTGGTGGRGGGGAGGPSYAVVSGGGATVDVASVVKRQFGSGGAGGAPNGIAGKSGERGP